MNAVGALAYSHLNYGLCLQHAIKDKQTQMLQRVLNALLVDLGGKIL
jgi:hypothetical protein